MCKSSKKRRKFGFFDGSGGVHTARTMMFVELAELLSYVNQDTASRQDYIKAIEEENCLGKPSGKSRQLTRQHLVSLYALDPEVFLFRALLFFWQRDENSRPFLALLCAYARDRILRESAPFILGSPVGETIPREATEAYFESKFPERFSPATLKSVAQNINGTSTCTGHLNGKVKKLAPNPNRLLEPSPTPCF